jgi:hypothetical protein
MIHAGLPEGHEDVPTLDPDRQLALVADEAIPEPFRVVPDVLGEALDDGDPNHIGGEDQGAVLTEGEMGGGEQGLKRDLLNAVRRVITAGFDRSAQERFYRVLGLARRQKLCGPLDRMDGKRNPRRPGLRLHGANSWLWSEVSTL